MKIVVAASCSLFFFSLMSAPVWADDAGIEDAQSVVEDAQVLDAVYADSQREDVFTDEDATVEADATVAVDAADTSLDATLSDLEQRPDADMADADMSDNTLVDSSSGDSAVLDVASADIEGTDVESADLASVDVGQFDVPHSDAIAIDTVPCVPGCVNESTLNSCSPSGALVVLTCPEHSLCQVDRCVMQADQEEAASACSSVHFSGKPSLLLALIMFVALLWYRRRRLLA